MRFYAREQIWVITRVSGSTAGHALFLIYESIFPISPNRPIGCLSKPRCWIQALTPASGALAGPQPIAPPRPFSCEDVIFLFLSPALPPPSLSLSSFSFLIPLSSPPPLLFSHRYVPLALKGIGFPLWTPPSHFRLPRRSLSSPLPSPAPRHPRHLLLLTPPHPPLLPRLLPPPPRVTAPTAWPQTARLPASAVSSTQLRS